MMKALESQVEEFEIGPQRSCAVLEQQNDKVKVVFQEDS